MENKAKNVHNNNGCKIRAHNEYMRVLWLGEYTVIHFILVFLLFQAYFIMTVVMVLLSIFIPAYMTDPIFQRSLTNCERLKLMKYNDMADVDIVEPYLSDCTKDELPFENVTSYDPRGTLEGDQNDNFKHDVISGSAGKHLLNDSSILYVMINVNQSLRSHKIGWTVVKIPNIYLPVRALVTLETITAIFFLCDFALRIATCPDVMRYFKSIINVSDAASLIGILVHTFMLQFYSHKRHYDIWVIALEYLQMLRSFRLFRIVKNVKASRVLVYSIFQNIKDLSVLGLFLVVGTCIFASILYVCEDNSTIGSIPVGWYWALVTMTTVGYGDVTPKTPFGRFFACLCATSGVLLFALTVPIFTNHFIILYQYSAINMFPDDADNQEHSDTEEASQSTGERQDCNSTLIKMDQDNTSTPNHIERFV